MTRSLHLCNLANVAYGYCKILEEGGHEVLLRCHDLKHLMSQPEWNDLELDARDFPDEMDFFNNTADFKGYQRPAWFQADGFGPQHSRGLGEADMPAADGAGPPTGERQGAEVESDGLATGWGRRLGSWLDRPGRAAAGRGAAAAVANGHTGPSAARFEWLIGESRKLDPSFHIDRDMLTLYLPHTWWAREHAAECDIVFSYIFAPIYSMIMGDRPFVSVEIGTMRDMPFERDLGSPSWFASSGTGRLLALAYRLSPHVLITNPDVVRQAEELGVESYAFCPHPLDEDRYRTEPHDEFRRTLLEESHADLVLFAPARQNWEVKRNDRYLRAFRDLVRDDGVRAVLVIPAWGQEVERSQRFCRELEIEPWVRWIPPQSELSLVKYYRAADFVLDQFDLAVFGLTTPRAMACGAVVVTSYDSQLHEWCFPEHPPLVAAKTTGEIRRALLDLSQDAQRRREIGDRARRWTLEHHSKRRIRSILEESMTIARDRHRVPA